MRFWNDACLQANSEAASNYSSYYIISSQLSNTHVTQKLFKNNIQTQNNINKTVYLFIYFKHWKWIKWTRKHGNKFKITSRTHHCKIIHTSIISTPLPSFKKVIYTTGSKNHWPLGLLSCWEELDCLHFVEN